MFKKLGDGLRRFMYGRYGMDALGYAIAGTGFVLLLVGMFVPGLNFLSLAFLIWFIFRSYSRNIAKRRQENGRFLRLIAPIRDRKNKYFRCPQCRQTVRVPRGKGKLAITCPKCGRRFEKKS